MKKWVCWALVCFLCLTGCQAPPESSVRTCRIVLEAGEGYEVRDPVVQAAVGSDVEFVLAPQEGYRLTGASYESWSLTPQAGGTWILRLENVRYNVTVRVTVEKSGTVLRYAGNGGLGDQGEETMELPVTDSHLRLNTASNDLFSRPGYTQTGWNTAPDGSGLAVGLGSRVAPAEDLVLYAQWEKWSGEDLFAWEPEGDGVRITAYLGREDRVCVPGELGGLPVRSIGAGAFEGLDCRLVILPDSVRTVENGAFDRCGLEELVIFDSIRTVSDHSFRDCENLRILRINAVEPAVYCGTYYATFSDKFDRLLSLAGEQKLVLFSGSSTRFGYDSQMLSQAFPDYAVVNMGVFAYTNAAPQLELILLCMGEGDILLHSPELDAAKRQFCTTTDLDAPFFNLMESNYDALALLDLRNYTRVFESLASFLAGREGMEPTSYSLDPADFDEDGNPVEEPSYNEYGDYILYRPNADTEAPIYGLEVDYTVGAYPKQMYIDPLNAMLTRFLDRGVRVYITWSPRNAQAISPESTAQARAELERYMKENLCVPVITDLESSLWSGTYLYGTDNHLSTQGVAIRTAQVIEALKAQLEEATP